MAVLEYLTPTGWVPVSVTACHHDGAVAISTGELLTVEEQALKLRPGPQGSPLCRRPSEAERSLPVLARARPTTSAECTASVDVDMYMVASLGFEWMWADAAILPGWEGLAKLNPLRWESLPPRKLEAHLASLLGVRPVRLRVAGHQRAKEFPSPQVASDWLRSCREILEKGEELRYPEYWTNVNHTHAFKDAILLPPAQLTPFQDLLDTTYTPASTRDRPCPLRPRCRNSKKMAGGCSCSRPGGTPGLPVSYRVRQVLRVEDAPLWQAYVRRRREISCLRQASAATQDVVPPWCEQEPRTAEVVVRTPQLFASLDASAAEMYLFHGTNSRTALKIAAEDVRLDLSSLGGGLGPGFYMSESVCKADEYASDTRGPGCDEPDDYYEGVFALLLMRVAMGKARVVQDFLSDGEKIGINEQVKVQSLFDSVLCDRRVSAGTFREFCVFDSNQIYTEFVIFYERVYADPQFGIPRIWAQQPCRRRNVLHFQVPSYWVNFHKNPDREAFDEEHEIRPRAFQLVLHSLQLLSGDTRLRLLRATRYESATFLREYVSLKLAVRAREGVSNPGFARQIVFSASPDRMQAFFDAGLKSAWSPENIDDDLNEVYLWARVPLLANGAPPNIQAAAQLVRREGILFSNPAAALRACAGGGVRRVLFLCRALCGQVSRPGVAAAADSEVFASDSTPNCCSVFRMSLGEHQIYPEMFLHIQVPSRAPIDGACKA